MDRILRHMLDALARAGSADAGVTMAEWVLVVFLIAVLAIAAVGAAGEGVASLLLEYANSS